MDVKSVNLTGQFLLPKHHIKNQTTANIMKSLLLITFVALAVCSVSAQFDVQLISGDWDYERESGAYEKIKKMVASSSGHIVAVGETIGDSFKDSDGLFTVLDAKDGHKVVWKKFGTRGNEGFNAVIQNNDGTFTVVGYTETGGGGDRNGWILIFDLQGNILKEHTLKGKDNRADELIDVAAGASGESVLAVGLQSDKNTRDGWLVNLEAGNVTANRVFPIGESDRLIGLAAGLDGNFVLIGSTGDRNRTHPNDAWAIKINKEGQNLWGEVKYFGDAGFQEAQDIAASSTEGGYVIAGANNSDTKGLSDMWLLKITEEGELEWQRNFDFGGGKEDAANAVVALSEGGYALLGHTKSHMPRAPRSTLYLVVTDQQGNLLDQNNYPIIGATDNEIGFSLVETYPGENLVIAGSAVSAKSPLFPLSYAGVIDYKTRPVEPRSSAQDRDKFGAEVGSSIKVGSIGFFDANGNAALEPNERGYLELEVTNNSSKDFHRVSGKVSTDASAEELGFWQQVQLGTLKAGQSKKLVVPVFANGALAQGEYDLNVDITVDETFAASSHAAVTSNLPDPPRLVVNSHQFIPAGSPRPGEPVTLTVELVNTGGLPSEALQAEFIVPGGVKTHGLQQISIPGIRPRDKSTVSFSFSYAGNFTGANIPVTLSMRSKGSMAPLRETFSIGLDNKRPAGQQKTEPLADAKTKTTDTEIYWIDPDPDTHTSRNGEVNKNELNVRAMALSKEELSKANFSVFVNGKKSQGQKMDEATLSRPRNHPTGKIQQMIANKLYLEEGINEVQIVYYAPDGITVIGKSDPLVFNYVPADKPSLYVFSFGVPYDNLKYTTKDARDFADLYEGLKDSQGKGFKKVDVNAFTTREETSTQVMRAAFERLTNRRNGINENDLLVIYLSAHGKVNKFGDYILQPSDYNSEAEKTYSLNFEEDILKPLSFVNCTKLVFVDACHSGNAIGGSKALDDGQLSKMINDLIEGTSGVEIFASCSDNEFSYEDDAWQNGAFTKAIKEAFRNEAVEVEGSKIVADKYSHDARGSRSEGGDGIITIEEFKDFLQKRVPYLVRTKKGKPQNPSNKTTDLLPKHRVIYLVNK